MHSIAINRPFDGTLIKEIPLHDANDVANALQVAHGLFQDRAQWLPAWRRIEILETK
jgi:acyl-CoA reductase-like NAD-dependent aldehyde dehydrogenase